MLATSESVIRACRSCGAKNRLPARHLANTGRCGSCKATLPPTDEPIDVDAALFDEIVREAKVPVLVDFWAEWCGPCRMAGPEIKALAREMAGQALVLKVDTEREPALANRFNVRGIPNFVVFSNGQVMRQQAGLLPRAEMKKWLVGAGAGRRT